MDYNPFYNIENPELMSYEYAWVHFLKHGEIPENIISKDIFASWQRCRSSGINAIIERKEDQLASHETIQYRMAKCRSLISIAAPILRGIVETLGEKGTDMIIVDDEKCVLFSIQSEEKTIARGYHPVGSTVDERVIGTNSFDLALRLHKPTSVTGAQHFIQRFHHCAAYATPVFGTDNQLIAAIGIIIRLEEMGHYMLAMIVAAAKAIENELHLMESNGIIYQQNQEKQIILDSVKEAILYVDEKKVITQANVQMTRLTGLKKEELIGKSITAIDTIPHISKVSQTLDKGENNIQVRLKGKHHMYHCLLNRRISRKGNGKDESNTVWIFTTIDEIRELADKINQENGAFFTFDNITGKSEQLKQAIDLAKRAAEHEARVIIEGESGTGKEMFAQSIHNYSPRQKKPFVAVDCGAIPRELLESEIFGYEEGAYTGARKGGHRGKFELAHKGTLFLDEIGNLPLEMQAKLLRVLQ